MKRSDTISDLISNSILIEPETFVLNTGIPQYDYIIGGLKPGIHVIQGKPNSRRSSLVLSILKSSIKNGLTCCYIDSPGHLHRSHLDMLDIDPESFMLARPNKITQQAINDMLKNRAINMLIIDTLTGIDNPIEFMNNIVYSRHKNMVKNDVYIILVNNMYSDYKTSQLRPYFKRFLTENATTLSELAVTSSAENITSVQVNFKDLTPFGKKTSFTLYHDGIYKYPYNLVITATMLDIISRHSKYIVFDDGEAISLDEVVTDKRHIDRIENIIRGYKT